MSKRTLHAFFAPASKKAKTESASTATMAASYAPVQCEEAFTEHLAYPFPIRELPKELSDAILSSISCTPRAINNQPDLDLLYYEPFFPRPLARQYFEHLRSQLPFYRVEYQYSRGGKVTDIRTPRYTTVFGLDATARFDESGRPVDATTRTQDLSKDPKYTQGNGPGNTTGLPRPLPQCVDVLRLAAEKATGHRFNFALVNYYADGRDSISYHADDEKFLGDYPTIASVSFGSKRDFCMKHKPFPPTVTNPPKTEVLKLPMTSGDMLLMKGKTQTCWLHAVPKRAGAGLNDGGRLNITFRKALVKGGTANFYQYNVGSGPVYRWDEGRREMRTWTPPVKEGEEEAELLRKKVVPVTIPRADGSVHRTYLTEVKVEQHGSEAETETKTQTKSDEVDVKES